MVSISFDTMRAVVCINGKNFDLYSGFITPDDLSKIAEVPSFSRTKPHYDIAKDVSEPPVQGWQRPLDTPKADQIRAIYSDTTKQNLMANPVLIGTASPNLSSDVSISVNQKVITTRDGQVTPVDNIFTVTVTYNDHKKPLWILDGQHRIEGMRLSTQKLQPMPFVLLYGSSYTPPFLAEIFTQVTTGATPMEDLHAAWMQYAFKLDIFAQEPHKKSMEVVIALCKTVSFGTTQNPITNPFHNKIQFNPYLSSTGYYAFNFDMSEWEELVHSNYYGLQGTLEPVQIAEEIVKAVGALESLDTYKGNGSRLFSSPDNHKSLADGFLYGLLRYLAKTNAQKSPDEWRAFFIDTQRQFDKCDWRLQWVRTTAALSSGYGTTSRTIARECFELAFTNPSALQGYKFTDYLYGQGAILALTAYKKTGAGNPSAQDTYTFRKAPAGAWPVDLKHNSILREIITVKNETPNVRVLEVTDPQQLPPYNRLREATQRGGLDVSAYPPAKEIEVQTMSYSGDTVLTTRIRLDK